MAAALHGARARRPSLTASSAASTAAAARSWLRRGRKLDRPTIGCVVMVWRGSRNGWLDHVGFYAGRAKNGDILLGGNHGDAVSIRPYPQSQLLGFRWPEGVPLPPDVHPVAESGVVRGTAIAAASGGTIVAENLPALVSELGGWTGLSRQFCSTLCGNAFRQAVEKRGQADRVKARADAWHAAWSARQPLRPCEGCGTMCRPKRRQSKPVRFCSRKCWYATARAEKNAP